MRNPSGQEGLFAPAQIRLAELSVCNWGSFHGLHTAVIDPHGTLVTGDNGAGKSTLVDALMALLLPVGRATFNVAAAQGDRHDRNLVSYMRGSYGSDHDGLATRIKSKREKAVITGLRALYRGEDGAEITLLALFWIPHAGTALSDVRKLYVVAKSDLRLEAVLAQFGDGQTRELKQWLRSLPDVQDCDERFGDYQALYRQYLRMENQNAPNLLARALGLKKIDNLTRLIRELVLEPAHIRDDARRMVQAFDDLVGIHERLSDARAQAQHLQDLPQIAAQMDNHAQTLQTLIRQRAGVPVFFARAHAALWQAQREALMLEQQRLSQEIDTCRQAQSDAQASVERHHAAFLRQGGERLETLRKDIVHLQDALERMTHAASRYQDACRALGLDPVLEGVRFGEHQQRAREALDAMDAHVLAQQNHFGDVAGQWSQLQAQLRQIEAEIEAVAARPDSNIPPRQQAWRDELQAALGLERGQLMFIGEMIEVQAAQHEWQGAIERALGGLRTTLLVPHSHYPQITRWLNSRHMGVHVRVRVVDEDAPPLLPAFAPDGILHKLNWRDHPWQIWLKHMLNPHDLKAVDNTTELDRTPYSITREGLQHLARGRFEKKDHSRIDDRREWFLGFSNRIRLLSLRKDKEALSSQEKAQQQAVQTARDALNHLNTQKDHWQVLSRTAWPDIDLPEGKRKLARAQSDLQQLEADDGDLQQARMRWDAARAEVEALAERMQGLHKQEGRLENENLRLQGLLSQVQPLLAERLDDDVERDLQARTGEIVEVAPARQTAVEQALDSETERTRARLKTAENSANGIISSFKGKEKWQPLTAEWAVGLDGLPDAIRHWHYLRDEGLPALVEQFRERLNKHTTQSLARLKNRLDDEHDFIRERIAKINRVLAKTEFRAGSYLKLTGRREKPPHVLEFEKKLKNALGSLHDEDHEKRFALLKEVMDILDKASRESAHTLESLRLLDPRYQLDFIAEEIDQADGHVRDVLDSSSGKSGGEKEAFAGMVVAASLAYVLTPDGAEHPVYCTVFLDEAFSNTAEAVSRRVLRVFQELRIHVNLITPYKNLNLARESARSLIIAERDGASHESRLCEITWEELDRQHAALLGIEWQDDDP